MKEGSQVLEDEQILFRAEVMAEVGAELLPSSGVVADMTGWRHFERFVLLFSWEKKLRQAVLRPEGID